MLEEDDRKCDERYSYIETKPTYGSTVLTGHWFHMRCENMKQSSTAVVPCVLEESIQQKGCGRHVTTCQQAFSLEGCIKDELTRDYGELKLNSFSNHMAQRTSYKSLDAEKYNRNFTSFNYLVYELWPRAARKTRSELLKTMSPYDADKKIAHAASPDPLDAYDNQQATKYDPKRHLEAVCLPPTSYKLEFKGKFSAAAESAKMEDKIGRLG